MPLTDSLVSYWSLDEASGNALDAHGSNTLVETSGTIDAATGKVNGCRDFEAGDTEYFTIADNTDLSTGDIDFTFSAWVQLESLTTGRCIGKWATGTNQREYALGYNSAAARFRFSVSSDGLAGTVVNLDANTLGAPSTATWYFIVVWHDATANTINIQVNDGTVDSTSYSVGVFNGTAGFHIGSENVTSNPWDGLIDEVGFWKRVLTSGERTQLYNSGNGLAYPFSGGSSPSASPSSSVSSSPSTSPSSTPSASPSASPSTSPSASPSASASSSPSASESASPSSTPSASPSSSPSSSPSASASASPSASESASPSASVSASPSASVSASPSGSPSSSPSASVSASPSASVSSSPSSSPSPSASVSASPSTSPSGEAATITIKGNVFTWNERGVNVDSTRLLKFQLTNADDVVFTLKEIEVS